MKARRWRLRSRWPPTSTAEAPAPRGCRSRRRRQSRCVVRQKTWWSLACASTLSLPVVVAIRPINRATAGRYSGDRAADASRFSWNWMGRARLALALQLGPSSPQTRFASKNFLAASDRTARRSGARLRTPSFVVGETRSHRNSGRDFICATAVAVVVIALRVLRCRTLLELCRHSLSRSLVCW